MYLGQVRIVKKRKPAKCDHCEKEVSVGESCFVVVRNAKSKKGNGYLWTVYLHQGCFLGWSDTRIEKRAEYAAGRKGGRPPGSQVKALAKENPELARERHKLVREQARLLRSLLVTEDDDRICELTSRIDAILDRLDEILGFQVKKFNRRSQESLQTIRRKMSYARALMRRKAAAERREQQPKAAEPAADLSEFNDTPEQERVKRRAQVEEIMEHAEAYRESGQVWREDGRD